MPDFPEHEGRWVPIPTQFHSLYHEGPFTRCIDCDRDLMAGDCFYFIERVFRGSEPVCEMAMCMDCRGAISQDLSVESSQRLQAFVEERFDMEARYEQAIEWPEHDIDRWLDQCVITKEPRAQHRNYQIVGICRGDQMSIDMLPMLISHAAAEEMQKLLSKKTRDRLGQMIDDFFGMPPEFADNPDSYSPLLW